jgi:hypothetical protein
MIGRWLSQLYLAVQLIPRTAVLSVVGPVGLLVFGYLAWTFWGAKQWDRKYYSVQLDNLVVTPQPEWIKSGVAQDVFHGSQLEQYSLWDSQASPKIANAFLRHPWVRNVIRVHKENGKVHVDLVYREPVAMVHVDTVNVLPIDVDGYLLPSNKRQDVWDDRQYLKIYVPDVRLPPDAVAGKVLGDTRVREAARLCQILAPYREMLGLQGVYVNRDTQLTKTPSSILEIFPMEHRHAQVERIVWGHAPGAETDREPNAKTKLQKLIEELRASRTSRQTIYLVPPPSIRSASTDGH